jgi:hypothetical protein
MLMPPLSLSIQLHVRSTPRRYGSSSTPNY